ncbi:dTDP-4-dehydrorhamnose reductase [uncultured Croceitalea sp.]|uniref:dTDP-4-dehydrorhamnose reductase n=1 Tax=uncultured Croceitalea sp. TaxID=1798908 RepID=UPI003305A88B
MKHVLVTGGNGQLASCIKDISDTVDDYNFIYVDIKELNITKKDAIEDFFSKNKISFCINCAAYTAVDKAESDEILANQINAIGARNLALACGKNNAILIHVSTDFVFDGKKTSYYTEKDKTSPLSVYGETKLLGEKGIAEVLKEYFIIRTSWLYSEHGDNFFKTMLRLGNEKSEIRVVSDQIGTPTYAGDLAKVLIKIIVSNSSLFGIYHYSNEGVASWYDFAEAIFDLCKIKVKALPIKSDVYSAPAERPKFSVMDKTKIKESLNIVIPHWRGSLKKCINKSLL